MNFCGSKVEPIEFDSNGDDAYLSYKKQTTGEHKYDSSLSVRKIITKHPKILSMVIEGKKGWGLWVEQWSQGIGEGTFTKYEILEIFEEKGIVIPEPFMIEFSNMIWRQRYKSEENKNWPGSIWLEVYKDRYTKKQKSV